MHVLQNRAGLKNKYLMSAFCHSRFLCLGAGKVRYTILPTADQNAFLNYSMLMRFYCVLLHLWLFLSTTIISIYESMFPGNSRVLDKHFLIKAVNGFLEQFQWSGANRSLIMGDSEKVNRERIKAIVINNPFVHVFGRCSRVKWRWIPNWGR